MKIRNHNRNEKQGGVMKYMDTIRGDKQPTEKQETAYFNASDYRKEQKRREHNQANRERNAAIRELCGTSAACARRDGSV